MPVLFTVPFSVMRVVSSITPPYCAPDRSRKVFSPNAGLDVLNNAIDFSPFRNYGLSPLDVEEKLLCLFNFNAAGNRESFREPLIKYFY
jgi:hypothetical protein